jgi:peptidoglycan/LPS O-acetylase OafA/YrhL
MFCKNCGKKIEGDAKFCGSCGKVIEKAESSAKNEPTTIQQATSSKAPLPGIEGWLALLCLGLAAAPFIVVYDLMNAGSNALVIFIDLILLGLLFFIWYLIYKRDHRFSKLVVIFLCVEALIGILGVIGTGGQDSSVYRPIVAAVVWIPYVLVSRRVKTTFII